MVRFTKVIRQPPTVVTLGTGLRRPPPSPQPSICNVKEDAAEPQKKTPPVPLGERKRVKIGSCLISRLQMLRSTLRLPSGGTSSRAATTGTVAANRHRLKVDPALWDDTQGHHDCSRAERLRVIRAAFRESGIGESMDEVELRRALGAVGYNPTEDQLVDIMLKVSKPFLLQRMDHELPENPLTLFTGLKSSAEVLVMREHQRRRLEKAFHLFDLDQSGSISLSELRDVLQALGCNPTEKEVVQIMAQVDIDGNGTLDMNEFLYLLDVHFDFCGCQPTEDLLPVFRLLDRRSRGFVTVEEVSNLLNSFWTPEEVRELTAGKDEKTALTFQEFVLMIAGSTD